MFSITPGWNDNIGKGFQMTFENGWAISVQWGAGNYCNHYSEALDTITRDSTTAEVAVFTPDGEFHRIGLDNDVKGYLSSNEVLELMNWTAIQ